MIKFLGAAYSRGATARVMEGGPALAPKKVQEMFPDADWNIIESDFISESECMADRFGDAYNMHKKIYPATPKEKHVFIGGDHSVNFSHFAAISDMYMNEDLCLIYFDAHFDIHNLESSKREATGSPHGTNVRHLLGEGDKRWLSLCKKKPSLKPENLFFLGSRSFEPAEIKYVKENNIFYRTPAQLQTPEDWKTTFAEIRNRIGNKKFVVSFDFDGLDAKCFHDVWVPEQNGLSLDCARTFLKEFSDAINFEFVEYAVSGDKEMENIVREFIGIVLEKLS